MSRSFRERIRAISRTPDRKESRAPTALLPSALVVLVAIGVVAWGLLARGGAEPVSVAREEAIDGDPSAKESPPPGDTAAPAFLLVHVAGAVQSPGVIRLTDGARVTDAIEAAGGLTPDAEAERVNLAAPVRDGVRIFVPTRGQPVPAVVAGSTESGSPGGVGDAIVDVNTATTDELTRLPGIGETTAEAIVADRERHGRFMSVDDLVDVRGIGPAKLEALRDQATV